MKTIIAIIALKARSRHHRFLHGRLEDGRFENVSFQPFSEKLSVVTIL